MSKRRNHDAAFKARVALEALKGEHEDGASEWGADLRHTTRAAMGLLQREHDGN